MQLETIERTALDAARAEGRAEAADALHQIVNRWLSTFAPDGERFGQFASALFETLASKVEDYWRDRALRGGPKSVELE